MKITTIVKKKKKTHMLTYVSNKVCCTAVTHSHIVCSHDVANKYVGWGVGGARERRVDTVSYRRLFYAKIHPMY